MIEVKNLDDAMRIVNNPANKFDADLNAIRMLLLNVCAQISVITEKLKELEQVQEPKKRKAK